MLEKQLALEGKLSESHGSTSLPVFSSSAQDGAARAAAGQLGIFSPAGVICSAKGPAWTRGELEPPQGAKRAAGGLAAAVYTPEQQERLGVDEAGVDTRDVHVEAWSPSSRRSSSARKSKTTFADEPRREGRVSLQGGGGEQESRVYHAKESIAQLQLDLYSPNPYPPNPGRAPNPDPDPNPSRAPAPVTDEKAPFPTIFLG